MKFYGQFNPPVDQILYDKYFKNVKNGISIEAGAFDGLLENSTRFFEEELGWKTINIEPLSHIFDKLVKNRSNSINLNVALSDAQGIKTIRVYDIHTYGIYNTNASITHTPEHKSLLEKMSCNKYIEQSIKTMTYTELINQLDINHLDLFVLDVEGHETAVINGMKNCNVLPDIFVIEHGHRHVEYFQPFLDNLNAKYKLDYVHEVNSFYKKY